MKSEEEILEKIDEVADDAYEYRGSGNEDWYDAYIKALEWVLDKETQQNEQR